MTITNLFAVCAGWRFRAAVRNIEYVELYVSDAEPAIDYFVSAMGFSRAGRSAGDGESSVVLRHGEVQLVITTGPATEVFLNAHGDGVADIAMACEDVAETLEAAVVAGASLISGKPGTVPVSGHGVARHTLLPVAAEPRTQLPPGRSWESTSPPAQAVERIRNLDHIAICVEGAAL
jgi:4-hydroxymandelate synthase